MRPCPSCGAANPPAARFCNACGARIDEGATQHRSQTRKTVTVLFCDVAGSTALGEARDPEVVRSVMAAYYEAMRPIIEAHGGTVEKFIGDAVMALFGIPAAHEDDALRAVRAAVEMRAAVGPLNEDLAARRGVTIAIRMGITTGEVVVGEALAGGTLATGDAVNTAARLQSVAMTGQVLLDAATRTLLTDAAVTERVPDVAAKGKAAPVEAHRLVSVEPGRAREVRDAAPMLGREADLRGLLGRVQRALAESSPAIVTVTGGAGVGKSRLVREAVASLEGDVRILMGRCLAYGAGITWWPLREVVHAAAGIVETDDGRAARARLSSLLAAVAVDPRVDDLIASALGFAPGSAALDEIFWSLRSLLLALGRERPTVIVLEDLHWAEPTLLDFLERLALQAGEARLALVATARPELLETRPGWGAATGSIVRLDVLDPAACAQLVEAQPGGAALPVAVADRIALVAEGNPLFVEEMVGMLRDDGALRYAGDGWVLMAEPQRIEMPPTIRALLAARLDALPPGERDTACRAAVIGRSFESAALAALCEPPARPALGRRLLELVHREVVRPERAALSTGDAFRFRHVLIRDAAYDALAKADRAELHEQFADWLLATTGDRADEYDQILGFHLAEAARYRSELGPSNDLVRTLADRAATHLLAAGRRAAWSGDTSAARALLERAWDIARDQATRFAAGHELAMQCVWMADFERAGDLSATLAGLAADEDDEAQRARAAVLGQWIALNLNESKGSLAEFDAARAIAGAAIEVLTEAGDLHGAAYANLLVGLIDNSLDRFAACVDAVRAAADLARGAGDMTLAKRLRAMVVLALPWGPLPVAEAIAEMHAVLPQFEHEPVGHGSTLVSLAIVEAFRGRVTEARDVWRRGAELLEQTGETYWRENVAWSLAFVEEVGGDHEAAAAALARVLAESRDGTDPRTSTRLAHVLLDLGRLEEAARLASTAVATAVGPREEADASTLLARVRLAQGDPLEARRLSRHAVGLRGDSDALVMEGRALSVLAEAQWACGNHVAGSAAMREAVACFEQKGATALAARAAQRWQSLTAADPRS